jgi:pimeloyl-ACP methyl ester carboxylesterase
VTAFAVQVSGATLVGDRKDGRGVPLVLVHGFGGSRRDWDAVAQSLPDGHPLVAYDQRGFGESRADGTAPFSHAADLVALLDALGIAQADLCGVSLGGATVLGCALAAPARVRRLVLISPMLAGWSWSAEWVERWKTIGRAARSGDMDQARALWFDHPLFATARKSARADELKQSIAAFRGEQWVRDDQLAEMPMVERLHAVAAPALLLTGGLDLPDFRLKADLIEGALPAVQRIDDPAAGHLLPLEQPDEIAAAITGFLQPQ